MPAFRGTPPLACFATAAPCGSKQGRSCHHSGRHRHFILFNRAGLWLHSSTPVEDTQTYKVWATDNMMYGPIGMATLSEWAQEGRVLPETWVHTEATNCWHRAKDFAVLRQYFRDVTDTTCVPRSALVRREELRNFVHFAG